MRSRTLIMAIASALLVTVLLTSFSWNGAAAGTSSGNIVGVVHDLRGNPIVNATVSLNNGISTTTSSNGSFELDNVAAGNYTLTVKESGRTVLTKDITVTGGQTTDLGTLTTRGTGFIFLLVVLVIPILIIAVVVFIVIHFLRKRNKRKENEELYWKQRDQQDNEKH